MTDGFVPAGGTAAVVAWLQELAIEDPGIGLWKVLVDDLRLALAQGWMLSTGEADNPERNVAAHQLAQEEGVDKDFPEMFDFLIDHWRGVYSEIDGRPCLVSESDLVGVDMELVVVTSEKYAGQYAAGAAIPVHYFITQFVGGQWQIAANARRLPTPGWPPSERSVPGSSIVDGQRES
jgi:hypothetical protein